MRVDEARDDPLEYGAVPVARVAKQQLVLPLRQRTALLERLQPDLRAEHGERQALVGARRAHVGRPEEDVVEAHPAGHGGEELAAGGREVALRVARRMRGEEHAEVVEPPLHLARVALGRDPEGVRLREEEGIDEGRHGEQVAPPSWVRLRVRSP